MRNQIRNTAEKWYAPLSLDLFPVDPVATPRNNGHSSEESTGAGGLSAKAQAVHHSTPKNLSKRDQQMSSVLLLISMALVYLDCR